MTDARLISERNRRAIARYEAGATLQKIGDEIGVTREAVRLIVKRFGGPNAEASRAARRAAKDAAGQQARTTFLNTFRPVAEELARTGLARSVVIDRLKILFPAIDLEVAEDALKASGIVFDHVNGADTFSNVALEAGIWYLLGSELGLKPDRVWAAVNLPQDLLDELGTHLVETSVSPEDLATILGVIGAAQRSALEDPSLSITGSRYNELRGELLDAMGLSSGKGAKPWPPTRQTIMKRYAGWNDALSSMGLAIAAKGRPKGLLIFSERDYAQAVIDFLADANSSNTEKTYANYGKWVKQQLEGGTRWPSPPAIRNYYGAWLNALRTAPRSSVSAGADAAHSLEPEAVSTAM